MKKEKPIGEPEPSECCDAVVLPDKRCSDCGAFIPEDKPEEDIEYLS